MWDRLPAPFRAWRIVITLFVAVFVAEGLLHAVLPAFAPGGRAFGRARVGGVAVGPVNAAVVDAILFLALASVALVAAVGVCAIFAARLMRSRGFDTYTLRRLSRILGTAATSDPSAWTDPRLAGILRPPRRAGAAEPDTPRELARGIERAAAGLHGAARAVAEDAAATARGTLATLEEADAEIARLAAGVDPTEAGRLRDRLAGLGAADGGEAAQMRSLLTQQLALLERMAERLAAARSERARAADALRALWRAVAALPSGGAEAVARVRAIAGGTPTEQGGATLTRSA
jgi:hypothetical protein